MPRAPPSAHPSRAPSRKRTVRVRDRSDDVTALQGGGYRSEFTVESQGCPPPQGGIVRMVVNTGSWTVEPLTAGSARVTYEAITDPVGSTPAWLVNRVNPRAIVSTFASLRRAAALPRYQQCGVDLAGCPAIRLHPPR